MKMQVIYEKHKNANGSAKCYTSRYDISIEAFEPTSQFRRFILYIRISQITETGHAAEPIEKEKK